MSTGRYTNAGSIAGLMNLGILVKERLLRDAQNTGDTAGTVQWTSDTELVMLSEAVVGVTAATDFGSPVFASDNNILTLTRPDNGNPVGHVKKFISAAIADVEIWSEVVQLLYAFFGTDVAEQKIALLTSQSLGGTGALTMGRYVLSGRGQITGFFADVVFDDTGVVAGDQDLILTIDATHRGGADVVITGANVNILDTTDYANGDRKSSTAITALNTYSNNDVLLLKLLAGGTLLTTAQDSLFQFGFQQTRLLGA